MIISNLKRESISKLSPNTLSFSERLLKLETIIDQYFSMQNIDENEFEMENVSQNKQANLLSKEDDLNLNPNLNRNVNAMKDPSKQGNASSDKSGNEAHNVQNQNGHQDSLLKLKLNFTKNESIKPLESKQIKGCFKLDINLETLNEKFGKTDLEIQKIQEKIRQIFKNLSLISAKPLGSQSDQNQKNIEILGNLDEKIQKLSKEIKLQYVLLADYQNFNCSTEKKLVNLSESAKILSESLSVKYEELLKMNNDLQKEISSLQSQNKEIQSQYSEKLPQSDELNKDNSNIEKGNGKSIDAPPNELISPKANKSTSHYSVPDIHLKHTVNELSKRMNDIQIQINLLKQNSNNIGATEKMPDSNISDLIKEIIESNSKIASKLDVKTLQSLINDLSLRMDYLKKEYEKNILGESLGTMNTEINSLKQLVISLDNKEQMIAKALKKVEHKVGESSSIIPVCSVQDNPEDNLKNDERFDTIIDEFNQKISEIRDSIVSIKAEYNKLTAIIDTKISDKVSKDDLIYFEAKFYKEIDKVVSTLTKKIYLKADFSKLRDLDNKVRKLIQDLFPTNSCFRELNEDAMLTKKPLGGFSCASCEKEIIDLYSSNLIDGYYAWNKFPSRDQTDKLKFNLTSHKLLPKKIRKEKDIDNLNSSNNGECNNASFLPNQGTNISQLSRADNGNSPDITYSKKVKHSLPRIKKKLEN